MIYTHAFYRNSSGGTWFIDLPEYLTSGMGSQGDLAMVAGADTLLDILAQGEPEVKMAFTEKKHEGWQTLIKVKDNGEVGGADYLFNGSHLGIDYTFKVWLCDVTKYVFGGYMPDFIHFTTI